MQLFKNLSTLFVGALLATEASAGLIKVRKGDPMPSLDRRNIVKRGIACDAAAEELGRRLRARDDVDQGGLGKGKGDKSFETHGLSDCTGLAVTIDLPEGVDGDDRWLLHYEAEETAKLEELKSDVEKAKAAGGTNVQVKVVHTDPETQVPKLRESLKGDIKRVMDVANGLAGTTVQPVIHPLTESYGMSIGSDKVIAEPENEGEWMNDKWKELYEKEMNGEEISDEQWEEAYDESDVD